MTEVEVPAPPPVKEQKDAMDTTPTEQEPKATQNGNTESATIDAIKSSEDKEQAPVLAHSKDREEHESTRVKEARQYNNRDRDRYSRGNYHNSNYKKNYTRNNKFDPSALPKSDDPIQIRKQIEFYFSDSNLLTDRFLFNKIEGNKNLPVPIDVIHSFKRMQHFQPRSAIVAALKESAFLTLVNDDNDIQRKEPLPEDLAGKPIEEVQKVHEGKSMAQSIYVKGFGEEEANTQFDIEAFFAKYGTTNSVRLRRLPDRTFKGSVFVEFDNEETAKNFVAISPPPKYKGIELQVKTKKEYCDDKVEDINAGKVRRNSPGYGHSHHNNDRRDLGKHDDRDWRLRRNEDAKEGFPDRHEGDDRDRRGGKRGFSGRGRGGRDRGGRGRDRDRDRGHHQGRDRDEGGKTHERRSAGPKSDDAKRVSEESAGKPTEKEDGPDKNKSTDKEATEPSKASNEADSAPKGVTDQEQGQAAGEASKKRQRESDETTEDPRPSKKLDTEES